MWKTNSIERGKIIETVEWNDTWRSIIKQMQLIVTKNNINT